MRLRLRPAGCPSAASWSKMRPGRVVFVIINHVVISYIVSCYIIVHYMVLSYIISYAHTCAAWSLTIYYTITCSRVVFALRHTTYGICPYDITYFYTCVFLRSSRCCC